MVLENALLKEVNYKAIRSSGSGGQHINKVATKVELSFSVTHSKVLSQKQKMQLTKTLASRLTKNGLLIMQSGTSRSQLQNKKQVTQRFLNLIHKGLQVQKVRKATTIPKAIKIKRLKEKRQQAERKANRKKPDVL